MKPMRLMLFLSAFILLACQPITQKKKTEQQTSNEETLTEMNLIGEYHRNALETAPYSSWFDAEYQFYSIDSSLVAKLKPLLENIDISIFMGTWCSDSQREIPSFFKILDALDYDSKSIAIYMMDEDKTTPEGFENNLNITNVPTIIFKKNGEEINRIVESPVVSLEKDMLAILEGKNYLHTYAE